MTKAFELRDLSEEELEARMHEQAENIMTLRMQLKSRKLDNPLSYRGARRELARIKSVLNEKRKAKAKAQSEE